MALTVSQGQVSLVTCTEDDTDVTVANQGTVDRLRRGNHLWRFVPGATPAIRSVGLQTGRRWRRRWGGLAVGAITARVNGWVQPRRVVCNAKQFSHRTRQSGAAVQHTEATHRQALGMARSHGGFHHFAGAHVWPASTFPDKKMQGDAHTGLVSFVFRQPAQSPSLELHWTSGAAAAPLTTHTATCSRTRVSQPQQRAQRASSNAKLIAGQQPG